MRKVILERYKSFDGLIYATEQECKVADIKYQFKIMCENFMYPNIFAKEVASELYDRIEDIKDILKGEQLYKSVDDLKDWRGK